MPRPKIHIHNCADPLVAGGSLLCPCSMQIAKSYIVAQMVDREDKELKKPWHACKECWFGLWTGPYVYQICEADSVPDLLLESVSVEGE